MGRFPYYFNKYPHNRYEVMLLCWEEDVDKRVSSQQLIAVLASMLRRYQTMQPTLQQQQSIQQHQQQQLLQQLQWQQQFQQQQLINVDNLNNDFNDLNNNNATNRNTINTVDYLIPSNQYQNNQNHLNKDTDEDTQADITTNINSEIETNLHSGINTYTYRTAKTDKIHSSFFSNPSYGFGKMSVPDSKMKETPGCVSYYTSMDIDPTYSHPGSNFKNNKNIENIAMENIAKENVTNELKEKLEKIPKESLQNNNFEAENKTSIVLSSDENLDGVFVEEGMGGFEGKIGGWGRIEGWKRMDGWSGNESWEINDEYLVSTKDKFNQEERIFLEKKLRINSENASEESDSFEIDQLIKKKVGHESSYQSLGQKSYLGQKEVKLPKMSIESGFYSASGELEV